MSVPWQPPPGDYLVTIYVDPPSAELPKGSIIEKREGNNWTSKRFSGNRIILTPETRNQPIQSPDGIFQVTIPPDSIQTSTVLTYTEEALTITNQPDIAVAIPASAIAYQLGFTEQTELTANATFQKEGSNGVYIYRRDEDNGNWIRVGGETVDEKTDLCRGQIARNLRVAFA